MKHLYYPGCSQKASSKPYETALLSVLARLGIELEELDDWNCCGATMAISCQKTLALSLPARNLALAQREGGDLVTPCPSCWLALHRTNKTIFEDRDAREKVRDALAAGGLQYSGGTKVRHVLDFLIEEIGLDALRERVTRPLAGVRIAPYYGCQIVRPYGRGEDPQTLEAVITAVGGEVAEFPQRTSCCGSSLMVTKKDLAVEMSGHILGSIARAKADFVVTPCGLCQVNLGLAGREHPAAAEGGSAIPVLNLPQVIGLALDAPARELGLPRSVARRIDEMRAATKTSEKAGVSSVH